MRPLIGITTDTTDSSTAYHLNFNYARAIELAGGLPVLLPYKSDSALAPEFVGRLDGVLFTGGNDLDPSSYGQSWHPKAVPIDPDRQRFEFALLAEVERRRVPALFVCLGCQALNVYRGGSLHQFIPDLPGKQEHRKNQDVAGPVRRHGVEVMPDSLLGKTIGVTRVSANTFHKQAIDRVGRGLVISARADDGIPEAIEDPSFPLMLGIQWHPERLAQAEAEHLAPFKLLIAEAIEYHATRHPRS